jgi:hypothetical protein
MAKKLRWCGGASIVMVDAVFKTHLSFLFQCIASFFQQAKTEFKYFIGDQQVFHSLEDSACCLRFWCQPCYPYVMAVKEVRKRRAMYENSQTSLAQSNKEYSLNHCFFNLIRKWNVQLNTEAEIVTVDRPCRCAYGK